MAAYESTDLNALVHEPINPVRACTLGEGVMMNEWLSLMNEESIADDWDWGLPVHPLDMILRCPVDQRAATVASSFVRWLGTNNGRCYLSRSRAFQEVHGSEAFLVGWVLENRRKYDNDFRMITYLLTKKENFSNQGGLIAGGRLADVSDRDNEVIESVASWLGTELGLAYLHRCETEMKRQHDEHMKELRERLLACRTNHNSAYATTKA
ncbi:hypothetical protein QAO71_17075 (plasmid) [Halopseudomonas sp. SMJS2]|uniref:hypothetical protein n=1 Tax=Halopseudomonas sp. SMJS2 TaxID=3041098 RepID=UPI0024536F0C|nr:hypothetical protein [Halopseudomonas sp. SMJS2]WGK63482.1 hypothetical protein QAO71_17075 [Halopseudomonas sp. SMJS2]